jgi:hypothetical protein
LLHSLQHKKSASLNTIFLQFFEAHPDSQRTWSQVQGTDDELRKDFPNV